LSDEQALNSTTSRTIKLRVMMPREALRSADYIGAGGIGPLEREIPPDLAGLRLDQALARLFPEHSRSRLAAWVKAGRVTVDAARVDAKRKVWGGERVLLSPDEEVLAGADRPEDIALSIVHEDESLLVLDKPAGLVVHPGSGNRRGTLLNALLHHAPGNAAVPRAGIVHRLDKDTTGLMVVAKTLAAHTDLVRQLAARSVRREYLALVHGAVAGDGEVDAPIGRHPVVRTRMAVAERGKPARTRYRVLAHRGGATLLECSLDTGRTHQIRVHMASIGHPLVGDPAYGPRKPSGCAAIDAFARQALHAFRLALAHPQTGASCEWSAPLPTDFAALLDGLA
jgi:23S rRNA pseudouridine1911/1915/1917 synthase